MCSEEWVSTLLTRKCIYCHTHLHQYFSVPRQAQEIGLVTEGVQWYLPDAAAMDGIFAINETDRDSTLAYDLRGTLGVRPCSPIVGAYIKIYLEATCLDQNKRSPRGRTIRYLVGLSVHDI